MPRYRIIIEYDGTPFVGWQVQGEQTTVQGAIQAAIFKFTGEAVSVRGAGRTTLWMPTPIATRTGFSTVSIGKILRRISRRS